MRNSVLIISTFCLTFLLSNAIQESVKIIEVDPAIVEIEEIEVIPVEDLEQDPSLNAENGIIEADEEIEMIPGEDLEQIPSLNAENAIIEAVDPHPPDIPEVVAEIAEIELIPVEDLEQDPSLNEIGTETVVVAEDTEITIEEDPIMFIPDGEQDLFFVSAEDSFLFSFFAPLQGAASVSTVDAIYACPEGHTYLSYQDSLNNKELTCDSSTETYRLLGGGSADDESGECLSRPGDSRLLNKAVCVQTSIEDITLQDGECPEGSARATLEEVAADTKRFCAAVGEAVSARIAFMGSIDGPAQGCNYRDYDRNDIDKTLCVRRKVENHQLVDANEDICGPGKTLLTVEEAWLSQQEYCKLLQPDAVARLAGGGSMDGSRYGCKIRDTDTRPLYSALCANARW